MANQNRKQLSDLIQSISNLIFKFSGSLILNIK